MVLLLGLSNSLFFFILQTHNGHQSWLKVMFFLVDNYWHLRFRFSSAKVDVGHISALFEFMAWGMLFACDKSFFGYFLQR